VRGEVAAARSTKDSARGTCRWERLYRREHSQNSRFVNTLFQLCRHRFNGYSMQITRQEVSIFKMEYCDENTLIAQALAESFADFMNGSIYDIGSGMGDITATSFPEREVVHVDILDYQSELPPRHYYLVGDFFTFRPAEPIGTMLLCHVLQFLDDDVDVLHSRIRQLCPERIVIVQNDNNGFMGDVVRWMQDRYPACNPEVAINEFSDLQRYQMIIERPIFATVTCPDFPALAAQIHYLVDLHPNPHSIANLAHWLESRIDSPSFVIEQTIRGYQCLTT
jgi:hypothetical protein